MCNRERIRGGAGRHQENRHVALEDLGEALLDPPRPLVIPVAECVSGVGFPYRRKDFRRNSGRVVTCEVHAVSSSAGRRRMQFCCAAVTTVVLCYVSPTRGATKGKEGGGFGQFALAPGTSLGHIRTALLSQLAATGGCGR